MPFWYLFVPAREWSYFSNCLNWNGGDDETRTRDLCRDRISITYNNLDGYWGLPNTSKYIVAKPQLGLNIGLGISHQLDSPKVPPTFSLFLEGTRK